MLPVSQMKFCSIAIDPAEGSASSFFFYPNRSTKIKLGIQAFLILIIFIAGLPILFLATLSRYLVAKLGPILCPGVSHILAVQASYRYLTKDVPTDMWCNILLRFKMQGRLNFEILKARFTKRFVLAKNIKDGDHGQLLRPELQQYPTRWAGYDFWKWESEFNIDEHIIHHRANTSTLTSAELKELEVKFLKTQFAADKSPWKILIIDNFEDSQDPNYGPSFLVLFKFHHSLCDGLSLFNALMECADEKVPELKLPTPPPLKFLPRMIRFITFPFRASYEFVKLGEQKSTNSSPLHVDCVDLSPEGARKRHFVRSKPLKNARIKKLAMHYGVSFTGIVLAFMTGGIRNLFLRNKKLGSQIPKYIVCEVPVPVKTHPEGLTNSVCVVSFTLPVGCPDIHERVSICEQSATDRKSSIEPQLTFMLQNYVQGILPRFLARRIPYEIADVKLSVFPGPLKAAKFCGHEIFEMSYAFLASPFVICLSMLTYGDGLQFCCTGDDRILTQEDVQQIVDGMEDEITKMENEMISVQADDYTKVDLPIAN